MTTDRISASSLTISQRVAAGLSVMAFGLLLIAGVGLAHADKLHNARTVLNDFRVVGDDLWQRFTGGKERTLWFYRQVATALHAAARPGEAQLRALIDELDEVVTTLEREVNAARQDEGGR